MHEVGRVADQQSPLVQGLEDERDVALLQVADSAVHELGAAAGSALGEVGLL
jgi:hypothetical protein